jgi:hypothetical protein
MSSGRMRVRLALTVAGVGGVAQAADAGARHHAQGPMTPPAVSTRSPRAMTWDP